MRSRVEVESVALKSSRNVASQPRQRNFVRSRTSAWTGIRTCSSCSCNRQISDGYFVLTAFLTLVAAGLRNIRSMTASMLLASRKPRQTAHRLEPTKHSMCSTETLDFMQILRVQLASVLIKIFAHEILEIC
ncbi:hypothetical protein V1477_007747 [Vespula maculifrons]|uniref:Uncharacterized protein n=1 Tax=Vespula maculifrons TaxID=7453 RepID=A0ABD2CFM3_VESMC